MSKNFKEFYKGPTYTINEDEELYKTLKRQISSYLNESTFERLHSIFNKIYLLRKCFPKDVFYDILLKEMNTEQKRVFTLYILSEGFAVPKNDERGEKEEIWEVQLQKILKTIKGER